MRQAFFARTTPSYLTLHPSVPIHGIYDLQGEGYPLRITVTNNLQGKNAGLMGEKEER